MFYPFRRNVEHGDHVLAVQEDVAGPADVLGEAPASSVGGVMANLFARASNTSHGAPFALGERGNILHHLEQPAIIPHIAESESKKATVEVLCSQ